MVYLTVISSLSLFMHSSSASIIGPTATRISQRGLKPDDSNYFLCDKTVSSVLKRGTMTERSCLQRGRRRLSGDFQSLRLPVSSTRTQSNDDLRSQGCIYRQALKAESLARVKL